VAEVLFFHHVQGLTPGVVAFADRLRAAGHAVHTPDLYGGRVFPTIAEGLAFSEGADAPDLAALAAAAAVDLPAGLVYAGISAGAVQAQRLAQTRAGAVGAVLIESCLPVRGDWAIGPWPEGVPVQIHGMVDDEYFAGEGDVEAARELVETVGPTAELFLYPGDRHLFEDSSLAAYDAAATELLAARIVEFLGRIDAGGPEDTR
jgi:dienelactone hydrolase